MNLDFVETKNNGYDIDTTNSFEQLFQVESVNQNESFIHGWNGYISEHYKYLSEGDIRNKSNGAILRCVWSLAIYDSETDKTYSHQSMNWLSFGFLMQLYLNKLNSNKEDK